MDVLLQSRAEQLATEFASQATTVEELNELMRLMMKSGLERMLDTEMDVHLGRRPLSAPTFWYQPEEGAAAWKAELTAIHLPIARKANIQNLAVCESASANRDAPTFFVSSECTHRRRCYERRI